MSDESELSLLNIYEVETDEGTKHLVGFQDPVLAGSVGLASHAMIGEFQPNPDGEFDPDSFTVNPEFVEAVTQYMNAVPVEAPALVEGARQIPGERLYVVDPRNNTPMDEDPPTEDVLGWYEVDDAGQVVPDSFQYNGEHLWFSTRSGTSGLLEDQNFYRFLHPEAHGEDEEDEGEE